MKRVILHKGADSYALGIGRSVQFLTKDIDDFVDSDKTVDAYGKLGYASRSIWPR